MRSTLSLALSTFAFMAAGALPVSALAEPGGHDQTQIELAREAQFQSLLYRDQPYDWYRRDWRDPPYGWRRDRYRRYDQRPYAYRYRDRQPGYDRYDQFGRTEPWRRGYGGRQAWWEDPDQWYRPRPPRWSQSWHAHERAPWRWRPY